MCTCQCCGYKTLGDNEHNYEICPICFWEDDPIQFENPFMAGGANGVSLITAQKNFILFESSEKRFKRNVRKIKESDEFDTELRLQFISLLVLQQITIIMTDVLTLTILKVLSLKRGITQS